METNTLFVWNINWGLSWEDLKAIFEEFGEVTQAKIIMDRETWRSRGFWFVDFASVEDAKAAKEALNNKEVEWRVLKVDFARKD